MNFIPFYIGLFIGLVSICLLILPVTNNEQDLWAFLRIRKLRHWVTQKMTQKWNSEKGDLNIIQISKKNIKWHVVLNFTFSFLMLQGQLQNKFLGLFSNLLLIPILGYFIGSIIQRQKIVLMINKKNNDKIKNNKI
jgi:hypothetical protein